jgi:hypothetical protein
MNGTQQLDKEIAELKSFIAELKTDRAAQKEKEQRESWTKYTSMSLVFIAVLAAIATQWAGKYSSRVLVQLNNSTFYQAEASDQWSYYQAKSIKQNLYEALREMGPKTGAEQGTNSQAAFSSKIAKYETEKQEVKSKAEGLEKERDKARAAATQASESGSRMGSSIAIFQISIALSSICLVTKKRWLWYLSMILALAATVKMAMVWLG